MHRDEYFLPTFLATKIIERFLVSEIYRGKRQYQPVGELTTSIERALNEIDFNVAQKLVDVLSRRLLRDVQNDDNHIGS